MMAHFKKIIIPIILISLVLTITYLLGQVNNYNFNKGGSVAVTIGEKDGYVMGPLMFWYIKNGELRIYSDSKRDYEPVELINKAPDHLILKFGNETPRKYIRASNSN